MSECNIYRDLAERTGGSFLLGVVGPVRTGKSSFIKRFMETLIIPNIDDPYLRERAKDELPQSASGRTIMTVEPKFVPEDAAQITLPDGTELSVRLIDSVGYMVAGAAGQYEDGSERMVTTPWFDHEVTITEAAETGTEKVIRDHSSIGIVITTDGSFGDLPREAFLEAEERVIRELQELGKPFALIVNSSKPMADETRRLAKQLSEQYGVVCQCINCLSMDEEDISSILKSVLEEFPLKSLSIYLPDWVDALPDDNDLKKSVMQLMIDRTEQLHKIRDLQQMECEMKSEELVSTIRSFDLELGQGSMAISVDLPRSLYYETISKETGLTIESDGDLISILSALASMRSEYEEIREALEAVKTTGYGVVYPGAAQMHLEEPQIIRQNGKYSVHLQANAPAIHMITTDVQTEVSPAIGGEAASEEIISFLLQGFDGDVNRIWESNIFGKSRNELAEEGIRSKIDNLPENVRMKLRETLQRVINESCSGLICLLL